MRFPFLFRFYYSIVEIAFLTKDSRPRSPLPGATKTKPGAATLPFFGIDTVLLDPTTGKEIEGNEVEGVLAVRKPWPSIARTVYGDHKRFLDTYMNVYPGYYFTGDGAGRDHDGYCELFHACLNFIRF